MKKPIAKFMNAAEIPPRGPSIRMATHASITWYAGESIRGRNFLIFESDEGRFAFSSVTSEDFMLLRGASKRNGINEKSGEAKAQHHVTYADYLTATHLVTKAWCSQRCAS